MKPTKTDQQIEDSLLQLLLPVARLLVRGGVGIDELVRAAKMAYIRAARQEIARQDGRVNISHLSVTTGMTRKEVSALLSEEEVSREAPVRKSGQQRALRVLRGWLTDSRFHNRKGRPDELKYRVGKSSFAFLVKLYGGDVTPKSVLRELERMEIVDVTGAGALRLRRSRSRTSIDVHYELSDLAKLFDDFAFAAIRPSPASQTPSFFAFKDSTVSSTADAAYFLRRFSRRAAVLLEDFQQWSGTHKPRKAASSQEHEAVRVGLGVYLLRADLPRSNRSIGGLSAVPVQTRPKGKRPH